MTAKYLFTSTFSILGTSILSAQTTAALHSEQLGDMNTMNTLRQLEQNALWALIGAVVLMGLLWICSIAKACAELNQPHKSPGRSMMMLLVLIIGLSAFCGSCSAGRWERAEQYRMVMKSEFRNSPCPHEFVHPNNVPLNNRYPSNGYSNWVGPSVCRFCGQVDFSRYH